MSASLPDISNEQKLTYIYHTLKEQEARRKHALWYRLFKWIIVLGGVYLLATYPTQIFGKISELIRPMIMEQVDTIVEQNKNNFLKSIKDILPDNIEVAPVEKVTPPVTKTGATTTSKTKASAIKK